MKKVCVYKQQPNRNIPCPYIKVSPYFLLKTPDFFRIFSKILTPALVHQHGRVGGGRGRGGAGGRGVQNILLPEISHL